MTITTEDPLAAIDRLVQATNAHDIERLVACFAEDYALDAPAHPERSFRGTEQVRSNWTRIFAGVPDISARLLRSAVAGDTAWTEWEMSGTRGDGAAHRMLGVFIFGVAGGLIRWGRMFLEPLELGGPKAEGALSAQLGSPPTRRS